MQPLAVPLTIYFLAVVAVICAYGVHRYWLTWIFIRESRHGELEPPTPKKFDDLPAVTVQLPMYNEMHVAERIIEAACAIDYPCDRLQIQVLDDSTDASAGIAAAAVERMRESGHTIDYHHRTERTGYKAGALAIGQRSATGEFIAIFDADFVPPTSFLHDTIHHFTDASIGLVQARWAHLNRRHSLLTELQSMYLDGHFIVEQAVRSASGRWFNFNGTAGVWRRKAIDDAGGWHHDTLTEDTDLSYRAQLAGWTFRFLPSITCPAEVPPTMSAFLTQQHRWNKGLMQNTIKLLPTILRSDAPLATKLEALFHLTCPIVHVAILTLVLMIAPALAIDLPLYHLDAPTALTLGLTFLTFGTFAASTFYVASQLAQGLRVWRTVLKLPVLMALGIGISVVNSKAVFEALLGMRSPFVRTPKYAQATRSPEDPAVMPRRRPIPAGMIEVALGLLMLVCLVVTITRPDALVGAPFLIMFAVGFLGVGIPVLAHALQKPSTLQRPRMAAQS